MTEIAPPAFFTEKWYNTENVSEYGYILHENRLLGAIQMRQKKVRNNSCLVADDFKHEILFCYAPYAAAFEDQAPFGPCENDTCAYEG
jgi:hypothetical protein